ncbi:carbohydrate ABC transporter membrane protein 1 (CUT1 family) [Streptomyces sp. SLBN-118]|uniref:carbohydrate ABC transporter permease n=1 Tax=Streptomyces sp. SLBN-118 TaxID=2768454 RepID=UPI001153CB0D|nr:sugar ABC transporter permease [Streptomyces sp. SLBN-118]TQK50769.1 carbohydrate ABC transporter membrane protein 1 (CUT1 family) [Streptomyces sp. SLBN-118]
MKTNGKRAKPRPRRAPYPWWGSGLVLLSPSLVLLAIFVYGLIGWTAKLAVSDEHDAMGSKGFAGLDNFTALFTDDINDRFVHSLGNLLTFTVVFMGGALLMGLLWAFLLDRGVRGEGLFRAIYLFPMAVSFVASGVVWRWLMNSGTGDAAGGLNRVFSGLHLGFLENPWWTDPDWGMAAMALPAIWQLSGYVMALFLSGFRGIPSELREAAAVDGATGYQLYRYVLFPQLTPTALSALIILGHMSMKMFDLIMSVSGAQWITEVPAVYVWQTLLTSDYAKAAAISIILLFLVALVIVPYLIYNNRVERRSS